MPKMKTHRAGAKRYKLTGTGKLLRRQAGTKHLLAHKSKARKNRLSSMVEAAASQVKLILKELPYAKKHK